MRILMVEPGPNFSVADVHRGWRRALERAGHAVVNYNLGDRLVFYENAHMKDPEGEWIRAIPDDDVPKLAMLGVEAAAMKWWPDLIVFTSAFYVRPETLEMLRSRGMKVAVLHTESPYEDDRQLQVAPWTDLNLINDPTNLESFQMVQPNSHYLPHAYDPEFHSPGKATPKYKSDVAFVGTGYPSRVEFLESVDWSGLDVLFGGGWVYLPDESPLNQYLAHDKEECLGNDQAVDIYRSTKVGFNLYRSEANAANLSAGWSMGPREIEMAACRAFFLRDPRGESDEVFSMLPTFTEPGELGELCRWWSSHDDQRESAAAAAHEAIAGWTFDARVEQLLRLVGV